MRRLCYQRETTTYRERACGKRSANCIMTNDTTQAVPATIWNDGVEVPNPNPHVYETKKYLVDYGKPYTSIPEVQLPELSTDLSPNPTGRGHHTNPPRPDGQLSPSYGPLYQGRVPKPGQKSNWDVHIYYKVSGGKERWC